MLDQDTPGRIQQPRTNVNEPSFAAPDLEITKSSPTYDESLLSQFFKIKQGPAPRQQYYHVRSLETNTPSLQYWQSTAELFLVGVRALKIDITEMLSKYKDSWNGPRETTKAAHRTTNLI